MTERAEFKPEKLKLQHSYKLALTRATGGKIESEKAATKDKGTGKGLLDGLK